jgi:hypothetical protein
MTAKAEQAKKRDLLHADAMGAALRRGGKSRGAYLLWLDEHIRDAKADVEYQGRSSDHLRLAAYVGARKAFTDEFYPT